MAVVAGHHQVAYRSRRRREFSAEYGTDMVGTAVGCAASIMITLDNGGVAPVRLVQDFCIQLIDVVRAEQPERDVGSNGQVQQCLVELALFDLTAASTRPHRFADTADRLAVRAVPLYERPPSRDDPGRIATQLRHVHEFDKLGVLPERAAKRIDSRPHDRHHDRLSPLDAVSNERHNRIQKTLCPAVHQRFMPVATMCLDRLDAKRRCHCPAPRTSILTAGRFLSLLVKRHYQVSPLVAHWSPYCGPTLYCDTSVRFLAPPRHDARAEPPRGGPRTISSARGDAIGTIGRHHRVGGSKSVGPHQVRESETGHGTPSTPPRRTGCGALPDAGETALD